jgi:membrane-bound serine protease (ClpP class)
MIIFLLLLTGAVLLAAEMFLPTHGILGVLGVVSILIGVGFCFWQNEWAGVTLLIVIVCISPFIGTLAVQWYPKTPLGKRMVLQPLPSTARTMPVQIGQSGQTVTALRPMGICQFGDQRLEAHSELGIIDPNVAVKVVAVDVDRITVRQC